MVAKCAPGSVVAQSKTLAVFDFDGTLTRIDTFNDFFRWSFGAGKFWMFIAVHFFEYLGALTGLVPAQHNKEVLAQHFLLGISQKDFETLVRRYVADRLPQVLRPDVLRCLKIHQVAGDFVVVASASPADWVSLWAESAGVENVVASQFARSNSRLTGRFSRHAHGTKKLQLLQELVDLKKFSTIHVYTDSESDRPLLNQATHQHLV